MGELRLWCLSADGQLQSLNKEIEKFKTGLSDRQEKFEGEQRVETFKIRSEVQSKTGIDVQKVQKHVKSYFKTVTKEGEK
eukprot:5875475-Amphidinium_carterae.1